MSTNKISLLLISFIIGNVLGVTLVPGQIFFPDEFDKLDFHPTTLSPAAKIPHQTTMLDYFLLDTDFEMPDFEVQNQTFNNETFKNFTKYKEDIDHLKSINDFAKYFNITMPEDPFAVPIATRVRSGLPDFEAEGILQLINQLIARIESSKGSAHPYVHSLDQANCEPELATVTLHFPKEKGVSYFPTCVRVQRCGGCCYLAHHSCQPTEIENMSVKVMRIQQQVTRARRRIVRNAEADFMVVSVEQHNVCDCKCKLQAKECIMEIHNYNEHQCACVCKNKEAELKCVSSNKHFWNNNKCKCLCRNELACSTGQEFDHETCSCVSVSINIV